MLSAPPAPSRPSILILLGAALLLLPAVLTGRPFIYWDTPTFYGWGRDIVEAVRDPWPPISDFPASRGLWAADNFPGAWREITSQQFQLVMTSLGARSKFYAVPFYALGSTLTLWAPAIVQALLASWLLWLTTTVALPGASPLTHLRLGTALTLATSAPLFVSFLMPDVFAAFALIASGLLLCFHDRLARRQRVGCVVLLAFALLVHLSILPVVAALLVVGLVVMRALAPAAPVGRGASLVATALVSAGLLGALSDVGMRAVFGQDVRSAPFLQGRVIVDGPGQQFLRETCAERKWAACLWKDLTVPNTDDIIWPDVTWHDLPLITDPAERRRFLDEQPAVVLGTLLHHPLAQLRASAGNALHQLLNFKIAYDVGQALHGLMNLSSDRRMRVVQVVPNIDPCLTDAARACDHGPAMRHLQAVHYAAVAAALAVLAVCAALWTRSRATGPVAADRRRLVALAVVLVAGVVLNAVVCGAFSGSYGRYQSRVVWLVPMAALLFLEHALRGGAAARSVGARS